MHIYVISILEKNNKILFLLRQNTVYFSGYYGLVGGKVDPHESVAASLVREVYEEVGLTIMQENLQFVHCHSACNQDGSEHLSLVFKVNNWQGEPVNREPEKHAKLVWFSVDELPENALPHSVHVLKMVQQGILHSETGFVSRLEEFCI